MIDAVRRCRSSFAACVRSRPTSMVTTAQAAISKGENGDSLTERDNMRGAKGVPDYRTVVMGFPTAEWLFGGKRSHGTRWNLDMSQKQTA